MHKNKPFLIILTMVALGAISSALMASNQDRSGAEIRIVGVNQQVRITREINGRILSHSSIDSNNRNFTSPVVIIVMEVTNTSTQQEKLDLSQLSLWFFHNNDWHRVARAVEYRIINSDTTFTDRLPAHSNMIINARESLRAEVVMEINNRHDNNRRRVDVSQIRHVSELLFSFDNKLRLAIALR